jgi:hypothetical protein
LNLDRMVGSGWGKMINTLPLYRPGAGKPTSRGL